LQIREFKKDHESLFQREEHFREQVDKNLREFPDVVPIAVNQNGSTRSGEETLSTRQLTVRMRRGRGSVELEKSMMLFRASIKRSMARGGSSSTSRLRGHRPPSFQTRRGAVNWRFTMAYPNQLPRVRTTQGGVIKLLHFVERKRKCAPSAEAVFCRCDKMAGKSQPRKNPPYNPTST